jgi:hypothetical protein
MATTEIRTTKVKVPNGDLQIDAYLAEPVKEGKFPAVIVIQEIFGEPIPLIIFVLQSLSLLRTENEKIRFSSTFSETK